MIYGGLCVPKFRYEVVLVCPWFPISFDLRFVEFFVGLNLDLGTFFVGDDC